MWTRFAGFGVTRTEAGGAVADIGVPRPTGRRSARRSRATRWAEGYNGAMNHTEAKDFELPIKIYYEDTDAGGVVYHAGYLRFMERARGEWLSELGFEHRRLAEERGVAFVVRGVKISYRTPARLDDRLLVRTTPRRLGRARIVFLQEIVFAETEIVSASAEVDVACIEPSSLRPVPIPGELVSLITERYSGLDAHGPGGPLPAPEAPTVLRAAGFDDVERLAELNLRLLVEERYDRSFTRGELCERMGGFLSSSYDAFFIMAGEEIAGYALVNRTLDPVYIRQFYVSPEYRRRGLGRSAVEDLLRAYRTTSADVEVMAWNETGMKFWSSLGFEHRYNGLRLRSRKE